MIHFSDIKAGMPRFPEETAAADTNFCGKLGAAQPSPLPPPADTTTSSASFLISTHATFTWRFVIGRSAVQVRSSAPVFSDLQPSSLHPQFTVTWIVTRSADCTSSASNSRLRPLRSAPMSRLYRPAISSSSAVCFLPSGTSRSSSAVSGKNWMRTQVERRSVLPL
jgi:hypothetical protein